MKNSGTPRLIFYTRENCSLCEKAKSEIRAAMPELIIQEIDVDSDLVLKALYGEEVPVGFIGEEKAFKYHVDIRRLRRLLG
ncbi:MAG: glutaredoxin family protein [Nitrospinaceae bacterium]|jgi:hypothetical protein|nr:glutaredoxin family protein [Nitrospinaceae bacterium]MBT3433977.1 glutaredoxin family protein [Nitrospinaceae bacterium]MBT3821821.1 glutaredoxin family protein [Nitrospinaceae bacterium]MBT4093164.1 glutaredoxin family protein [Nitrospinaceae bacterium]MBT4429165.1 glutaredoxin family protein [Nitrospinaceae bacterium]